MIDVALLSIIRRWHLRDHVSLREIAKRLGISRNTVRRYLRSGTIEPTYSRAAGPTVLDGYAEKLSERPPPVSKVEQRMLEEWGGVKESPEQVGAGGT